MDVSIIIVNYNTKALTLQCFDSIYKQTKNIEFEVILVDNDSHDGTVDAVRDQFPQVNIIESGANLGFGRANNLGYKYAKGRHIFFLNSDTILVSNAVKELNDFLDYHNECSVVGAQLVDSEGNNIHSYALLFTSLCSEINYLFGAYKTKHLKRKFEEEVALKGYAPVAYITGADMMIDRRIIEKCGLFDPDFFMYYEEAEMSYRFRKNGAEILFYPKTKIVHLEGKSFSVKESRSRMYGISRKLYYRKTQGLCKRILAHCVFSFTLVLSITVNAINGNNDRLLGSWYSLKTLLFK